MLFLQMSSKTPMLSKKTNIKSSSWIKGNIQLLKSQNFSSGAVDEGGGAKRAGNTLLRALIYLPPPSNLLQTKFAGVKPEPTFEQIRLNHAWVHLLCEETFELFGFWINYRKLWKLSMQKNPKKQLMTNKSKK